MLTDLNYKIAKEKLMAEVSFEDFYKVPDLKFDVSRLKEDLDKVLEKKKI